MSRFWQWQHWAQPYDALREAASTAAPSPHRCGCRTGPDGDVLECKVYTGFQALNAKKKKKFKCQVHIHICERIDPCVEGLVALGKRSQRLWCPRVEGQPHPPRPAGGGPVFSVLGPHRLPGEREPQHGPGWAPESERTLTDRVLVRPRDQWGECVFSLLVLWAYTEPCKFSYWIPIY